MMCGRRSGASRRRRCHTPPRRYRYHGVHVANIDIYCLSAKRVATQRKREWPSPNPYGQLLQTDPHGNQTRFHLADTNRIRIFVIVPKQSNGRLGILKQPVNGILPRPYRSLPAASLRLWTLSGITSRTATGQSRSQSAGTPSIFHNHARPYDTRTAAPLHESHPGGRHEARNAGAQVAVG